MVDTTQTISIPSGNLNMDGYFAKPEGAGPFPGIVVIHEAFGLNDDIRGIAQRFAEIGYAALAIDLFAGRNHFFCMFRFMSQLMFRSPDNASVQNLKDTLTFLAAQPGVDAERLGAIGFCMGGSFSIAWACTDDRLKAIAPFYAVNPRPIEAVKRLCPVVGSYPQGDFTTGAGQKLDEILDRYEVPHDIKVYPGAKHSFFNAGARYNDEAAKDVWQRITSFFKEHLVK